MKITFELQEDSVELFGEATNMKDSLHEALCQAIHEGNEEALEWLQNNVMDVAGE